jgi:hypothetical protein
MTIPYIPLKVNPKKFMQDSYKTFMHELKRLGVILWGRNAKEFNDKLIILTGYKIAEKQMYLTNMIGIMESQKRESQLIDLLQNMDEYTSKTIGKEKIDLSGSEACSLVDKIALDYKQIRDSFD